MCYWFQETFWGRDIQGHGVVELTNVTILNLLKNNKIDLQYVRPRSGSKGWRILFSLACSRSGSSLVGPYKRTVEGRAGVGSIAVAAAVGGCRSRHRSRSRAPVLAGVAFRNSTPSAPSDIAASTGSTRAGPRNTSSADKAQSASESQQTPHNPRNSSRPCFSNVFKYYNFLKFYTIIFFH